MKGMLSLLGVVLVAALACCPAVTNPKPSGDNVICFGDSLTFGTGAGKQSSYPAQLESLIGRPVINAGVPGDTTATALRRLEQDVLQQSPQLVLITLGGNDLKNGIAAETAFANLETIVLRIQETGALVIVGGIDVPVFGRGFGDGYRQLCKRTGAVLVPNVYEDIMGRPHLMADRIHPNAKGYTIMAEHFFRAAKPYL